MENLRKLLTGSTSVAKIVRASAVTATLVSGFADKVNAQAVPTIVSEDAGLENADLTPEAMIYLEPATGRGVLQNEISPDKRSLTVSTSPNGSSSLEIHVPVQKGATWNCALSNDGGFKDGESMKKMDPSATRLSRQGDTGVFALTAVSPDALGDYAVVVECSPDGVAAPTAAPASGPPSEPDAIADEPTGEVEELRIVYRTVNLLTFRPGVTPSAGTGSGFGSLTRGGLILDASVVAPIEPVSGDGVAMGIGAEARVLKALTRDSQLGLHLMGLDMPTDVKTEDGSDKDKNKDDKLVNGFCGSAFAELGMRNNWGDAGLGLGYGMCAGSGDIPGVHGPSLEANVGVIIGNLGKVHGRLGGICWAGNNINESKEAKPGWHDNLTGCGVTLGLQQSK